MRALLRLIAWCFAAPYIAVGDEILVRVGAKRRVATGRPAWRTWREWAVRR